MTAWLARWLVISLLYALPIVPYSVGYKVRDFYRIKDYQRRNTETKLSAKSKISNNNKKINPNVEQYLHLRELVRLQKDGASYEDLKEASLNGTSVAAGGSTAKKANYQRLLGKGNLDQRLRAIISYKRNSIAAEAESKLSEEDDDVDDEELLQLMDDESEDEELDADEEEALYESAVLKAMEQNKLDELKSRLLGEQKWDARSDLAKQMRSEAIAADSVTSEATSLDVSIAEKVDSVVPTVVNASQRAAIAQEDLYTPAVSTWGVFQRPRDISKAYGGGRAITREEMNRMDEEIERQQEESAGKTKQYLTASMKVEEDNKVKIKEALDRGRGYMTLGNRNSAVQILESVRELVSWQSDFGGEVLLELGMALETVDRTDDSRQIYGKLASTSWSQKIRRQATGLISGLDITKQIRKQVYNNSKPVLDYQQMQEISEALAPGLRNNWNEYKKGPSRKDTLYQPWFDDNDGKTDTPWRVSTLTDAYNIFLREMNPLKKVPSDALMRAFRRFYVASHTEKFEFMRGKKKPYFIENAYSRLNPKNGQDMRLMVNGSWELVSSGYEQTPYLVKHYEPGSLRRFIDVEVPNCKETSLVFWGMSSVTYTVNMDWNGVLHELSLTGDDLRRSSAPWQKTSKNDQVFQVL